MIPQRPLGRTGLTVSALGFGGATIGFADRADERRAAFVRLARAAADLGVTLFDTAPDYRDSETILGEALAGRDGVVLATKAGRVQRREGDAWRVSEDWSPEAIETSVEESRRRLRVEAIDLVQLHSPPHWVIETGDALAALERCRARGQVRHIGISADGDDAVRALELGGFETLQTSYSLLQQQPGRDLMVLAAERSVGVIAKQPLANAVMTLAERPPHPDWSWKWELAQRMAWPEGDRLEHALRWVLAEEGMASAIVGTASLENLRRNAAVAAGEPLSPEGHAAGQSAFDAGMAA